MKIAYIDTNYPDCIEDYHTSPSNYGGGRVVAAALLDRLDDFHIYADQKCFANIPKHKKSQCHSLAPWQREQLRLGCPVLVHIPEAKEYNIFFHHFADIFLNLDGCLSQQAVWPVGWREVVHPSHKNVLLFDAKYQQTQIPISTNIYNIVIGPKFPIFQENKKEDFIFQCSRHFSHYHSIDVAKLALDYGIQTYFAGPIEAGYPLMNYIDNKTTHYLGIIDDATKRDYYQRAKLNTQFQDYGISVTLAGKEAASHGTPILATDIGGWKDFIQDGINGFFIRNAEDFVNSWNKVNTIKQENCYNCALQFSEEKMVETVLGALQKINQ